MTRLQRSLGRLAWQRGCPKLHRGPGVGDPPWMMGTGELGGTSLEKSSLAGLVRSCLFGLFVAGKQVQTAAGEKGEEAEAF